MDANQSPKNTPCLLSHPLKEGGTESSIFTLSEHFKAQICPTEFVFFLNNILNIFEELKYKILTI